jgi:N-sulfoglucosamine sulfohydrolase
MIKNYLILFIAFHSLQLFAKERPNILLVVGEDMSWKDFSSYGNKSIATPNFDSLADSGVLFEYAYAPAPSCAPSRSGILTGRPVWQLGPAASIHTFLPTYYVVFQDLLEDEGYTVGFTGKGWGPGEIEAYGRNRNPAGNEYKAVMEENRDKRKMLKTNSPDNKKFTYADNLDFFLRKLKQNDTFSFWIGTSDAHRPFEKGKYKEYEIDPTQIEVPPYFPDNLEVRKEIADYLVEVKQFDETLGQLIEVLKNHDKLQNTVIIVTADHGWPFPRGKGTLYEDGMRVPLVINYPKLSTKGRNVTDMVNLIDLAPTILELAGTKIHGEMCANSLLDILTGQNAISDNSVSKKGLVFFGHERHSPYRENGLGYPMRAVRSHKYYYIENKKPERWPAGDPPHYDDPSDNMTVKDQIMISRDTSTHYFELCYGKRPSEELYDMEKDPFQVNNLANVEEFDLIKKKLKKELAVHLEKTNDPRAFSDSTYWDRMPWIRNWAHPEYMPDNQEELILEFNQRYK